MRHGSIGLRLFASRKPVRSVRRAHRRAGLDRRWSGPHILSLNCRACGYRFEAIAIYSEAESEPAPLAA